MIFPKWLVGICCCSPFLLCAQTNQTPSVNTSPLPPSFRAVDVNKDGYITREEAQKAGVSNVNFDSADKNKDGKLNLSEWTLIKFD
jgi:Ca2+-binding EF-hand superfamily protein